MRALSSNSYLLVNKYLIKELGLHNAIVLSELCTEFNYYRENNRLKDKKFFSSQENISNQTGLSKRQVADCVNELEKLGLITTELKGLPAIKHYEIIERTLYKYLNVEYSNSSIAKNDILEMQKTTLNINDINNNNINNNNINIGDFSTNGTFVHQRLEIRDKSLENRDKNKEKNIGDFSTKNAPALSKVKFVIPTIEEIQEVIDGKNYNIDAEQFFAYYDQMGWKLSNGNKMQNWKSALTTWNKREPKQNQIQTKTQAIDFDKMTRDQIHIEIKKVVPNIHIGFCWKYIDENYYIFKNKTHSMMNGSEYYKAMMQASSLSHCKVREENKNVENQNAVYNIAKNLF